MADTQNDAYVRRDVFEARMDRMEMLLEKTTAEIKSYVNGAVSEVKAEVLQNRNEIQVLTARVDSLEHVFYWGLGGFGIILASAVIIPAIIGFLKNLFKPPFTLKDMEQVAERVANTVIERHLSGGK